MKKLSMTMENMEVSSVRKLTKYAVNAKAAGKKVYHLNIGQPDLPVPVEYYKQVRNFHEATVEYMPSQGMPELLSTMVEFYNNSGIDIETENVLVTVGGSEAVLMTM